MICEITIEELLSDYDWAEVFGEGSGGNTTPEIESLDGTSDKPVLRTDVAHIIAAVNGCNDEADWVGVFLLKDGRYLAAQGGCDYTGWDCQAYNRLTVASTLDGVIKFGLAPAEAKRLGLDHPGLHPREER